MGVAYAIGVLGFGMRRFNFPVAPVILGPLAEARLRRLLVSDGDWTALVNRPFAVIVLVLAPAAVVGPFLLRLRGNRFGFAEED